MEQTEILINEALKNSRGLKYIIAVGKIYKLKKVEHAVITAKRDLGLAIRMSNTCEEEYDYDPKYGEWYVTGVRKPRLEMLQTTMSFQDAIAQVIKEEMIRAIDAEKIRSAPPICPFPTTSYDDGLPF